MSDTQYVTTTAARVQVAPALVDEVIMRAIHNEPAIIPTPELAAELLYVAMVNNLADNPGKPSGHTFAQLARDVWADRAIILGFGAPEERA